jgi:hypothetical protein
MPPEYRGESATGFLGFGNPAGSPPQKKRCRGSRRTKSIAAHVIDTKTIQQILGLAAEIKETLTNSWG